MAECKNLEISIYEVKTKIEREEYWKQWKQYMEEDIFIKDSNSVSEEEKLVYSEEHKRNLEWLLDREIDRGHIIYFKKGEERIGFCFYCTYLSEDKKCFIIDFCIDKKYRSMGYGTACFQLFMKREKELGAEFFELNASNQRNQKFWKSQGFLYNGYDKYKTILYLLPSKELGQIQYEELKAEDIWQIQYLINGYKFEIGEDFLTEEQQEKLEQAIEQNQIYFIVAKRKTRVIGMCSICPIFSTFECEKSGIFEDFYIEPVFRRQGTTRKIIEFAFDYCKKHKINTLLVGSSQTDEKMYQELGFQELLGTLLCAKIK